MNGRKMGTRIASEKQIAFLFSILQKHIEANLLNAEKKTTRGSVKPLIDRYTEEIEEAFYRTADKHKNDKSAGTQHTQLRCVSADTIADLFNATDASSNSQGIYQLAGLALLLDGKVNDIAVCANEILHKKSWTTFLTIYNMEIHANTLKDAYLLYYWKEGHIHIAEMVFTLNEKKTQWTGCQVTYYDYDKKKSGFEKNQLKSEVTILDKPAGHNALSLYILHDNWQITQFTIAISSDIMHKQVFICSYSSHNKSGFPFSGIGILKKYPDTLRKITDINSNGIAEDEIFNFLYEGSNAPQTNLEVSNELPNAREVQEIESIRGIWKAYYLRNAKPEEQTRLHEEIGGIELNYLHIQGSGSIFFKTDESGETGYPGFLSYPLTDNRKFIKANFLISPKDRIYKIHMFLRINDTKNILEGVMVGWSNKGRPFGCLIRLEKADTSEQEASAYLHGHTHKFYKKADIESSSELSASLINFLRNNRKFLDLAEDCLPRSLPDNKALLERLSGKFYLLSRDYQEGLLDKAKLEIFQNGNFQTDYPEVSYKGYIKEFITNNNADKYIYLDIIARKIMNDPWLDFSGGFLFNIGNLIDEKSDKLMENTGILVGLSLRKNANNLLQAKKEILIPAEDQLEFLQEESHKYMYTEEDKLIKNLKKNTLVPLDYKTILKSLRGKENNIMLLTNNPVAGTSIRETDYFEIYMNAFLFEVIFSSTIDYPKIYNYLIQSLLHLDNTDKLIDKIKSIYNKYQIDITLESDIPDKIKPLHADIIFMARKGQLTRLSEILKSPLGYRDDSPVVIKINTIINSIRKLNIAP